ncbi:MAG TPA: helix-turn-helix transcriptional regulator [Acetobacteraceae bacterium]|nr:helix-turn-helix transcriptional regulator [Acetobacteraceae bacterium]
MRESAVPWWLIEVSDDERVAQVRRVEALVGDRIREARIENAMTLTVLARRCAMRPGELMRLAGGKTRASATQLCELARCLQRPISYFFSEG